MAISKKNPQNPSRKPEGPMGRNSWGNAGNAGASRNYDEQHGIRGSQLNANTTGNTGKSKHRGE